MPEKATKGSLSYVSNDGENFVNLRGIDESIALHSGAHKRRIRTQFRFHNNQFRYGQINILLALTDIGPGDGAIEVHLKAGDAILFVDAISHGSARRINPDQRRIAVYLYGPNWGNTRFGYRPSDELLLRLTPERRRIVQPVPPLCPPQD